MLNDDSQGYPGKGKLYSALHDFRYAVASAQTIEWPRYWREFADQAYADLIALECLMEENGIKFPK